MPHPAINVEHLPHTNPTLSGRDPELNQITAALNDPHCALLTIVGDDGIGKTSLINYWLHENSSVLSPARIYGWSFFNQGSVSNKTIASDFFIEDALRWFGDPVPSLGSPWDRGRRLGQLLKQSPTLLVLDGVELLQTTRGPQAGHIGDPALQTLLTELAADNSDGLTILTTRLPITNLWTLPVDSHRALTLEPFNPETGAAFLRTQGIEADNHSLREASVEFEGHPLALNLLATFVRDALDGNLDRLGEIPPLPDDDHRGGQARRVLQAYADWFGDSPELNILYLLGLFNRPADTEILAELREPPAIPHLTNHFFRQTEDRMFGLFPQKRDIALDEDVWDEAVANLHRAGLLVPPIASADKGEAEEAYLDAHPLVRLFFARQLGTQHPKAWQAGHKRLYEHLADAVETYPDTLMEMRPLYDALAHACRAGLAEEALEKIYWERISRKEVFYSSKELGAFGADLAMLANAFSKPWHTPVQSLQKFTWAALLNWTGTALRALGRLEEARQPLETALTTYRSKKDWKQVSVAAANLSMLALLLGDIPTALQTAAESVRRAKKARDESQLMLALSAQAEALLQAGNREAAAEVFAELEQKQRMWQADYRYLYSRRGYHYCDLLLSRGEFVEVIERAGQTIEIARTQGWPMYEGLDHLSLGRARLGLAERAAAGEHLTAAVEILQREGARELLPPALLGRAEWQREQGQWAPAQTDIEAALGIVLSDGMKLFAADAYLSQAWLALAQGDHAAAEKSLGRAQAIINETGYHRRDEEAAQLNARLSTAATRPQS